MRARACAVIAIALAEAAACHRDRQPAPTAQPMGGPQPAMGGPRPASDAPAGAASARACELPDVPARRPAPRRLVAIGDLHGDAAAARAVLRTAGAIDEHDHWSGGDLVVVQLGDVLDRGDGEQDILDLLARLDGEARAAGGALVPLLGNHELMNAAGDFRYVTRGGFADFEDVPGLDETRADVAALPAPARARAAALFPGGPYARQEAGHDAVVIVGDTLFAHGGVEPAWAGRIDEVNRAARCWLAGEAPPPAALDAEDGPVWSRRWAGDDVDCAALHEALAAAGASRMVVAHTVQMHGASSACDGAVWRIDVGLAALYGGPIQALEITHDAGGDHVRVLEGTR